jgi:lipid-binding SYLF domain-containing protein
MRAPFISILTIAALLSACSTAPRSDSARASLTAESRGAIAGFTARDSTLRDLLNKSVGYAVFPAVGKAGLIGGGAYGRGEVYERGNFIGWADLSQGSIGLQIGAQSYDELILFLTQDQLNRFTNNQFAFSANVSAVALAEGAAAAADHSKGVVVFVRPQGGLMAEASVGGQQFTFRQASNDERMNNYGHSQD